MNKKMTTLTRTALLASLALTTSFAVQAADEQVELKFAHWVPAKHALATLGIIPWAKSIEAASNAQSKSAYFRRSNWAKHPTTTIWFAMVLPTWRL